MILTKIEQMVYDWYVFMGHNTKSLNSLLNRFKLKRLID